MKNNNGITLIALILIVLLIIMLGAITFVILNNKTNTSNTSANSSLKTEYATENIVENENIDEDTDADEILNGNSKTYSREDFYNKLSNEPYSYWILDNYDTLKNKKDTYSLNFFNTEFTIPIDMNKFINMYNENIKRWYYTDNKTIENVNSLSFKEFLYSDTIIPYGSSLTIYSDSFEADGLIIQISNLNDQNQGQTIKECYDNQWLEIITTEEFAEDYKAPQNVLGINIENDSIKNNGDYDSTILIDSIIEKLGSPSNVYIDTNFDEDVHYINYYMCYEYEDDMIILYMTESYDENNVHYYSLNSVDYCKKSVWENESIKYIDINTVIENLEK